MQYLYVISALILAIAVQQGKAPSRAPSIQTLTHPHTHTHTQNQVPISSSTKNKMKKNIGKFVCTILTIT